MNLYDRILYSSYTHPQTHPERLAVIGRLMGMSPARISQCRVLELGCGDGSNLVPMAAYMLGSEFVGVDLAERPVSRGQKMIADLGLNNIQLHAADICQAGDMFGRFDYIIAHGLYSWVPENVRRSVLATCRRSLNPHGIAFISYNAFPGCHQRRMLREMMLFHIREVSEPEDRVLQAKAFLQFLSQSKDKPGEYRQFLLQELERVEKYDASQLFHDDLSEVNDPFYFHQFASASAAHGLQYLAEADFHEMSGHAFSPATQAVLSGLGEDRISREQYLDFLKCRRFRQTLLCHHEVRLNAQLAQEVVQSFLVSVEASTKSYFKKLNGEDMMVFENSKGARIETDFALGIAALRILEEQKPLSVDFSTLCDETLEKVRESGSGVEKFSNEELAGFLVTLYQIGLIDFRTEPNVHAVMPGENPKAFPLVRWQAANSESMTSTYHVPVQADDEVASFLIPLLDGTRDRKMLVEEVINFLRFKNSNPSTDDVELQPDKIHADLDRNLMKLGKLGLLQK